MDEEKIRGNGIEELVEDYGFIVKCFCELCRKLREHNKLCEEKIKFCSEKFCICNECRKKIEDAEDQLLNAKKNDVIDFGTFKIKIKN